MHARADHVMSLLLQGDYPAQAGYTRLPAPACCPASVPAESGNCCAVLARQRESQCPVPAMQGAAMAGGPLRALVHGVWVTLRCVRSFHQSDGWEERARHRRHCRHGHGTRGCGGPGRGCWRVCTASQVLRALTHAASVPCMMQALSSMGSCCSCCLDTHAWERPYGLWGTAAPMLDLHK